MLGRWGHKACHPATVAEDDLALARRLVQLLDGMPDRLGRAVEPRVIVLGSSRGAQLAHRFGPAADVKTPGPPCRVFRMQAPGRASDDSPAHRHLALWLLTEESNDADGADATLTAAERSCQKLCIRLAKLVTPAGSRSLLARAIHLAATDAPFLRGVRAGTVPGECLEGVRESAAGIAPDKREAGLVAVVAHLVGLLALFVGADVTARLVRDVWPGAPFGRDEAESAPREVLP